MTILGNVLADRFPPEKKTGSCSLAIVPHACKALSAAVKPV
jgi:hypothetical protein